jgi:hypothetical protein
MKYIYSIILSTALFGCAGTQVKNKTDCELLNSENGLRYCKVGNFNILTSHDPSVAVWADKPAEQNTEESKAKKK